MSTDVHNVQDWRLAGLLEAAAQLAEHGYPKSGALIEAWIDDDGVERPFDD